MLSVITNFQKLNLIVPAATTIVMIVALRLANLAVPAHLLTALDDPIIPACELEQVASSPNLDVIRSPFGGHCGFMDRWRGESWADREVARLLGVS